MLSVIPFALLVLGGAYVFSLVKMAVVALEAPIGYEDAAGFHYGMAVEPVASSEVVLDTRR